MADKEFTFFKFQKYFDFLNKNQHQLVETARQMFEAARKAAQNNDNPLIAKQQAVEDAEVTISYTELAIFLTQMERQKDVIKPIVFSKEQTSSLMTVKIDEDNLEELSENIILPFENLFLEFTGGIPFLGVDVDRETVTSKKVMLENIIIIKETREVSHKGCYWVISLSNEVYDIVKQGKITKVSDIVALSSYFIFGIKKFNFSEFKRVAEITSLSRNAQNTTQKLERRDSQLALQKFIFSVLLVCFNYLASENVKLDIKEQVLTKKHAKKIGSKPIKYYLTRVLNTKQQEHTVYKNLEAGLGTKHHYRYDVRANFAFYTKGAMAGRRLYRPAHQRGLANENYIPRIRVVK